MSIEMAPNELVDLLLGFRMHILELMHGLELDNIQPIRQDTIGFPLKQMFTFPGGNMRHCGEHVATM